MSFTPKSITQNLPIINLFHRLQDVHTSAFFTYLSMNRWFGVALDWTITVYSAICVFSFMLFDDGEMSSHGFRDLGSMTHLSNTLQYNGII